MLAAASHSLQAAQLIDLGVLVLGGACFAGFVGRLIRSGRWRNPLADVETRGAGPTLAHALVLLLLYFALALALTKTFVWLVRDGSLSAPGSGQWYAGQNADTLAKIICAAAMMALLRQMGGFAAIPGGWGAALGAGVLAGLIVVPLCIVQLNMTVIVGKWLEPGWSPALHPALLAVQNNAWGAWGAASLFFGAAIVAPTAEELFFRGLVLGSACRYMGHAWLAVLISALAFGLVHQAETILALCTMGVLLGYLRLRTGSLVPCIVAHGLFNTRTMILALFFPELIA